MDDEDDYGWVAWIFILVGVIIWFVFFRGTSDSDIRKECQREVDNVAWNSQYEANSTYFECMHRNGLEK